MSKATEKKVISIKAGSVKEAVDALNNAANKRSYIILGASLKDDLCDYNYEVTGGVGIGDGHKVDGTGIIEDDLREAFAKLNVHLAVMDEVYKHSKIEVEDIDQFHMHELTLLYRVKSFKIKKSKGYESITLVGEKYVRSASGWMGLTSPEVALDNLGGFKWYNELKTASDNVREEVALYKEGKCTAPEVKVKVDKKQASLFDGKDVDQEMEEELEGSKLD